jgi:pheromone a factor receptor
MAGSNNGPSIEGVVFPFLTLLTILLSIAPFIWHIKHRNLPASSLVFWIVLVDIFYFINALIWPNDDLDSWWRGYGLCDLEVKLQVAATIGIPTSLVCIMRNLARVLDTSRTVLQPSPAQRRRQYAIEALLCFGAPVYMIIAHYVVQNVRYYIFGISGCVPGFDNSWPSIVLIEIWSPFFSVVAVYYSSKLRIHYHERRLLTFC